MILSNGGTIPSGSPTYPLLETQARDSSPQIGIKVRTDSLRSLVAASWARSEAAGAVRSRTTLPPVPLEGPELAGYQMAHPLRAAMPICRDLLEHATREAGWIFAVLDADGVLLWIDGDPTTRHKISRVNFVEGALWSESGAGTNAPGTALATGQPVQIIGREHYHEAVQDWSCAAAPLRDPDSGRVLGVLDITGGPAIGAQHVLALVRAAAKVMEARLARLLSEADTRARKAFPSPAPAGTALVSHGGRILEANGLAPSGLAALAAGNGTGALLDGRRLVVEPVGISGYSIVRLVNLEDQPDEAGPPLRLSALGTHNAVLQIGDRSVKLSPRQSEIVVLLALADGGLSAGDLAQGLFQDEQNTLAVRVDMSRLRSLIGEAVLGSRPYRLLPRMRSDVQVVRDLLAQGQVRDALGVYAGPLLPCSKVAGIVEHRVGLERRLRAAILTSGDAWLLQRWVDSWGGQDLQAWETLAGVLPVGTPQQAAVAARLAALRSCDVRMV